MEVFEPVLVDRRKSAAEAGFDIVDALELFVDGLTHDVGGEEVVVGHHDFKPRIFSAWAMLDTHP